MKNSDMEKKIRAGVRKHYVRKSSYNRLKKKHDQLQKRIARLEKICGKSAVGKKKKTSEKVKAEPATAAAAATADQLTRIKGIGPVLQGKLNKLGINTFAQIAGWSAEDIEQVSGHLDFKGRIEREDWILQAEALL